MAKTSDLGEDIRVGLTSRSNPPSMNFSVRFTKDALIYVDADQFEFAEDQFLDMSIGANSTQKAVLRVHYFALKEEREGESVATWRRLEAKLGYDVDQAPDELIRVLLSYVQNYGHEGVEEAIVVSQGEMAAEWLEKEIRVAKKPRLMRVLHDAVCAAGHIEKQSNRPIWEISENAATMVRQTFGVNAGPMRNNRLFDLMRTTNNQFRGSESEATGLGYGLRLREGDGDKNMVALNAFWPSSRRFEMCRILGDAIWSKNDALGPISKTKTDRQKLQRAFAQSLLCPYSDLLSYINTEEPSEEDIFAATHYFHVSERIVQTVLIKKGKTGRQKSDEMVEAA